MGRPVILGNNGLTVGLNEHGLVHDFYYPYVGLDNLTTARSVHHKIGVWVDGTFSWVDDGSWNISVDFSSDALISSIIMENTALALEISSKDFVDSTQDVFGRQLTVKNLGSEARDVRVFLHQVFQISRAGRADTALYVPDGNYLLDYKGNCALLIYGQDEYGKGFDQFAVGNYGIEGKEGTFRDAEDGELSGSAVEHGGVDSVMRFVCPLAGSAQTTIDYWIVAADCQQNAEIIHKDLLRDTLTGRLQSTMRWWHEWFATSANALHRISPEFIEPTKKSLMVIKAHFDKHGGIIASCDSSIYNYGRDYYSYVWPRDGAYAIWPLIRMGFTQEAKAFFSFCASIMKKDGYLMHKYQPDKAIGSTWHPLLHGNRSELAIQEDETAIVLYMIGEYLHYSNDEVFIESLYDGFIRPAANFIANFIDDATNLPHASYDLWEEKFLTNTYTVGTAYEALLTASDLAHRFQHKSDADAWTAAAERIQQGVALLCDPDTNSLRKGFLLQQDGSLAFDNTLDVSSLYAATMFNLFHEQPEVVQGTIKRIETELLDVSPAGGLARYQNDHYFEVEKQYPGNPWIITTLWMAQYYIRVNQDDKARKYIVWALAHAANSGAMPEQIHPTTGAAISVSPLVWSHAEFINTILDATNKK